MAAARAQEPDNPLTLPCHILIAATDEYLRPAKLVGAVRESVQGADLFLTVISIAWIRGTGATDAESVDRLRALIAGGYRTPTPGV